MHLALILCLLALDPGCSCNGHPGSRTLDLGAIGFGGDAGLPTACVADLTALALAPADSTVTLDGNSATPIAFSATGTFSNGHTAAVAPDKLAWIATRTDATDPGTISAGVLQPNPSAGGVVTISATDGCVVASTTVTFQLAVTIGTPSNAGAWSNANPSTTSGTVPDIVYPSDQTRFPRNIYRTLFQWHTHGYSDFRLTFAGPFSTITVYSDGNHPLCAAKTPAAGCWEADETSWSFIAGSNAGQTVTWTLDALDTSTTPATPRHADPITIGFSKQDVVGAIFYWSTTSAGVRRANIRDALPEDYITGKPPTTYSNPTNTVQCVACHTVSRDGKYMVAPVQSSLTQSLWVMEVTATPPPTPLLGNTTATIIAGTKGHGFATISPDDAEVVAAWGGKMWSLDRTTGKTIVASLLPGGSVGTQPDWSPDNTQLVYATGSGDAPSGASIAVLPYNNPGWGMPKVLAPANDGVSTLSNLFPSFSPDGKWITYSRGKGGHDDLTAQLFLISGQGGATTELINANRVVSNQLGNGQTENSQPTWAPPGDLYWIAFNSQREYGVVAPAGTQQIWVAAIDPHKLGSGDDPSFPAFRLQFQGLGENNHRAFWTLDVREPPPGPPDMAPGPDMAKACIGDGKSCDPVSDVCCGTDHCDTTDNGQTYTCMAPIL